MIQNGLQKPKETLGILKSQKMIYKDLMQIASLQEPNFRQIENYSILMIPARVYLCRE